MWDFSQFQRGPTWPNGKLPMSASSSDMLVDCIGNSLLFAMAVVYLRLRFIKWKPQITVFSSRKGVVLLTYSRGPMTSMAWGPVGHCTSGRPLNPPLRARAPPVLKARGHGGAQKYSVRAAYSLFEVQISGRE